MSPKRSNEGTHDPASPRLFTSPKGCSEKTNVPTGFKPRGYSCP